MVDVIRDAPIGQLIRFLTRNKYLQYPDEKPDFKLPQLWQQFVDDHTLVVHDCPASSLSSTVPVGEGNSTACPSEKETEMGQGRQNQHEQVIDGRYQERQEPMELRCTQSPIESAVLPVPQQTAEGDCSANRAKSIPVVPEIGNDRTILVDWYDNDDAEDPHNWSNCKRTYLTGVLCFYTFIVYTTSAIYISSTEGVMEEFGISQLKSTLGLAIYVLGYGIGPLIFSPLSEIPRIGRNPVYVTTMLLFVLLSIPTSFAPNYTGLIILRFLQGFFGSPCLASGGASLGDLYSLTALPFAMLAWVSAAFCGPALGPLLSGFAVPVEGWRWSLFISIWGSGPIFVTMFMSFPETSSSNILLRRAQRLRKLTGNNRFMSQSELDQRHVDISSIALDALIKPLEITIKDPAILFVQIYTAIIYGIYYSFFEVFPLVYPVYYSMNLGQVGLVFLCIFVSCIIGSAFYVGYLCYYMNPRIAKFGMPVQESRLAAALPASFGPAIGLFVFSWTARASVHWIIPTIGISIYVATGFVVNQCIYIYVPLSYPKYAASLFAANSFFRSALAFGSVLFAQPLFGNLGVPRGTSLLGGLSIFGILGIWLLYLFGARLRARSKFAISAQKTTTSG